MALSSDQEHHLSKTAEMADVLWVKADSLAKEAKGVAKDVARVEIFKALCQLHGARISGR